MKSTGLLAVLGATRPEGLATGRTGVPNFVPATQGCGMAHCDPQMSDRNNMLAPKGDLELVWEDREAAGNFIGLGCSSNGIIAACALGPEPDKGPYLRVYNGDGDRLWDYPLNLNAWSSAPMIDEQGRVIAADNEVMVLFDSDGTVLWKHNLPGGLVISPVVIDNGLLLYSTLDGFVVTVDPMDGSTIGKIQLEDEIGGIPGTFGSRNTPCVNGNRIYVSTEFKPRNSLVLVEDETRTGRLYAIDIRQSATSSSEEALIEVVWHVEFGSRSGSSPVFQNGLIYFDGDFPDPNPATTNVTDPHFFAVEDMGDYGYFVLQQSTEGIAAASAASDPRPEGGVWFSNPRKQTLYRLGRDPDPTRRNPNGTPYGQILETVHTSQLGFDNPMHVGYVSATSIGKNEDGDPVLMFCVLDWQESALREDKYWHMGYDLVKQEVRYKGFLGYGMRSISTGHGTTLINSQGETVLALALMHDGVIGLKGKTSNANNATSR
jgi:outer membrane protein assembly factor BamB